MPTSPQCSITRLRLSTGRRIVLERLHSACLLSPRKTLSLRRRQTESNETGGKLPDSGSALRPDWASLLTISRGISGRSHGERRELFGSSCGYADMPVMQTSQHRNGNGPAWA